ncbi:hypothetical protein [Litchfieldia salsa]|uniref:Threonine dehydratase n=1 Tax=Litchfieldia salsa TaxID=930152 RepID=A0A1H0TGJ9_9BACI|nr:hypothetical protein [Litchfieldia salsa]SDP52941.1 hypothetical protein SAMN05216565_103500 [Litchfieldia salsa]
MEYSLLAYDSAYPCEVTIDEDNGRYMIRKADTSGEVFNEPMELIKWVKSNWSQEDFRDPEAFENFMQEIENYGK